MLLTREDFNDRPRYLNASNALHAILDFGAVPVINENDTVSVAEIGFGENDALSALVANLVSADLLILLTVVDGLYEDPDAPPERRRVDRRRSPASPAVAKALSMRGPISRAGRPRFSRPKAISASTVVAHNWSSHDCRMSPTRRARSAGAKVRVSVPKSRTRPCICPAA